MSDTPILDALTPMPPRTRRRPLGMRVLLCTIGFAYGAGGMMLAIALGLAGGAGEWAIAFVAAAYASTFVHELGHLVAGLCLGFRLQRFRVWPFVVSSDGARLRLKFDATSYGAFTVMMPLDFERYHRQKVWYSLGGPAANALLAAAAAPWVFEALAHRATPGSGLSFAFFTLMISSLVAVFNLVPASAGPFRSDGAQALEAWRRAPAFFRELALLRLSTAILAGTPSRDLDAELIARAIELGDGSRLEMGARQLAFARAVGRDDLELAAAHLERALAVSGSAMPSERAHVLVTCAVFFSWHRIDVALARTWMERARASSRRLSPVDRCRLDIFEPWIDGRREDALAGCDRYLALIAKLPQLPVWQPMRDDAVDVREKIATLPLLAGLVPAGGLAPATA